MLIFLAEAIGSEALLAFLPASSCPLASDSSWSGQRWRETTSHLIYDTFRANWLGVQWCSHRDLHILSGCLRTENSLDVSEGMEAQRKRGGGNRRIISGDSSKVVLQLLPFDLRVHPCLQFPDDAHVRMSFGNLQWYVCTKAAGFCVCKESIFWLWENVPLNLSQAIARG